MKNKSTMLLVGIGVAYLLYRLYAKKTTAILPPGIVQTNEEPLALYPEINPNGGGAFRDTQYLVDSVPTAEVPDTPGTYQTLYVRDTPTGNRDRILGISSRVPATC